MKKGSSSTMENVGRLHAIGFSGHHASVGDVPKVSSKLKLLLELSKSQSREIMGTVNFKFSSNEAANRVCKRWELLSLLTSQILE